MWEHTEQDIRRIVRDELNKYLNLQAQPKGLETCVTQTNKPKPLNTPQTSTEGSSPLPGLRVVERLLLLEQQLKSFESGIEELLSLHLQDVLLEGSMRQLVRQQLLCINSLNTVNLSSIKTLVNLVLSQDRQGTGSTP